MCLARDQVFPRNIGNVLVDVLAYLTGRGRTCVVRLCFPVLCHRFQRELRVDGKPPLVGHQNTAIGPHSVAERELKIIAAFRQTILNDDLHPALPESTALLLACKDRLQRGHLGRKVGDVFLRRVDR